MFASNLLAVGTQGAVPTTLSDPLSGTVGSLGDAFGLIINLVIGIGWALVVVMLALGFVQYVTSRGEKTAVKSAQDWLTYAVIGGVGLFFIGVFRRILPQLLGTTGGPVTGVVDFGGEGSGGTGPQQPN